MLAYNAWGRASQQPLTTKKVSFKKEWDAGPKCLLPSLTTWIQPLRIHMVEKKPISHKLSYNLCIYVRLWTHAQDKFKHFLQGKSWKQSLIPKVMLVFSGASTTPYEWCTCTQQTLQQGRYWLTTTLSRTHTASCVAQCTALRTNPMWRQYRAEVAWVALSFTIIQISSDRNCKGHNQHLSSDQRCQAHNYAEDFRGAYGFKHPRVASTIINAIPYIPYIPYTLRLGKNSTQHT